MSAPEKVIMMKNSSVHNKIQSYLNDKRLNSQNTANVYRDDIVQFFRIMKDKELNELKESDLVFENSDIVDYKIELKNRYSDSTVNRKMSTVYQLFLNLSKDYAFIRPQVFKVDRIRVNYNSYGSFTWEETEQLIQLSLKSKNGLEKSIMIELAARTSIRLNALCNIEWSNIEKNQDFYVVKVFDKGRKQDEKPIPASLYERMLLIKKGNKKVFSLSSRTFERTIEELVVEMGLPANRNLTFHSLKKMGVEYILETTGDIFLAAEQGNHSNIQTTNKHYTEMNKRKNISRMAGLHLGAKIEKDVLSMLTKEELIEIFTTMDYLTQARIVSKAEKLVQTK